MLSTQSKNKLNDIISNLNSCFYSFPSFLHFDIKPQNIIYDKSNRKTYIIDFEHSRFGDFSHELFRGDTASKKSLFFSYCWKDVKSNNVNKYGDFGLDDKLRYYKLFYCVLELSYRLSINNSIVINKFLLRFN